MIVNLVDIWRRMDFLKSSPHQENKNFKTQGINECGKNMRKLNIIKKSEQ